MKDGVIATIRINDAVTLTLEYEGDLIKLFERIDDIFKSYEKVFRERNHIQPLYKRIFQSGP